MNVYAACSGFQAPAHAPDPILPRASAEAAMANFAAAYLDGLVRIIKRKLKKTQY